MWQLFSLLEKLLLPTTNLEFCQRILSLQNIIYHAVRVLLDLLEYSYTLFLCFPFFFQTYTLFLMHIIHEIFMTDSE
jgi:hypothetical protein